MSVSPADAVRAADRIQGRVRRTPVAAVSPHLIFKLEHLQHTGSFKPRGAFNRMLAAKEDGSLTGQGVVVASGGNAGMAVAYVARELGVPARVYVPLTTPAAKLERLRGFGADVVQVGRQYAEAYDAARQEAEASEAVLVHAYDQPEVVAGQATLGLELLSQVDAFDTVLVAVGGGGLLAGIATAVGTRATVVGVEPELAPTMHSALVAGAPVDVEVAGCAADSLGARRLGDLAFAAATAYDAGSVLVTEEAIVAARRELWREFRLAVEHGTAAAYAALTSGAYRPAPGERVVVVICGANTDPSDLIAS
jgi:threonine dehydratase